MTETLKLKGIIPPMVTPLSGRDRLDCAGLERLIEHILAAGVHGLFILGTTGEATSLSYHLRRELTDRVCRQVNERVPVLVGIADTSFVESVNLAHYAAEAGAKGVVLAPPYYFPAGQDEIIEYIDHLTAELPLPLTLYNMPSHTKLMFGTETIRRVMDNPAIAGIKDSSGDMVYFHRLQTFIRDRRDFHLLVGPEELLAETVLLGGDGGVSGGANLFPRPDPKGSRFFRRSSGFPAETVSLQLAITAGKPKSHPKQAGAWVRYLFAWGLSTAPAASAQVSSKDSSASCHWKEYAMILWPNPFIVSDRRNASEPKNISGQSNRN